MTEDLLRNQAGSVGEDIALSGALDIGKKQAFEIRQRIRRDREPRKWDRLVMGEEELRDLIGMGE